MVEGVSPKSAKLSICDVLVWTLYHWVLKHFYEMLQQVLEYLISDDKKLGELSKIGDLYITHYDPVHLVGSV